MQSTSRLKYFARSIKINHLVQNMSAISEITWIGVGVWNAMNNINSFQIIFCHKIGGVFKLKSILLIAVGFPVCQRPRRECRHHFLGKLFFCQYQIPVETNPLITKILMTRNQKDFLCLMPHAYWPLIKSLWNDC